MGLARRDTLPPRPHPPYPPPPPPTPKRAGSDLRTRKRNARGMAAMKMYGRIMDTVKMAPRTISVNWGGSEGRGCGRREVERQIGRAHV